MSAFRETVIASPSGAFHTLFRCSEGVTTTVAKYKRLKGKAAVCVGTSAVKRSSMIRQTVRIRSARAVGVFSPMTEARTRRIAGWWNVLRSSGAGDMLTDSALTDPGSWCDPGRTPLDDSRGVR